MSMYGEVPVEVGVNPLALVEPSTWSDDSGRTTLTTPTTPTSDPSKFIQVQLPRGAGPGSRLNVRIPGGELVTIVVPEGAEPGTYVRTPLSSAKEQAEPQSPAASLGAGLMAGDASSAAGATFDVEDSSSSGDNRVGAALDAETVALRTKQRGAASLALCVLGAVLTIMSSGEFNEWARKPMASTRNPHHYYLIPRAVSERSLASTGHRLRDGGAERSVCGLESVGSEHSGGAAVVREFRGGGAHPRLHVRGPRRSGVRSAR